MVLELGVVILEQERLFLTLFQIIRNLQTAGI